MYRLQEFFGTGGVTIQVLGAKIGGLGRLFYFSQAFVTGGGLGRLLFLRKLVSAVWCRGPDSFSDLSFSLS